MDKHLKVVSDDFLPLRDVVFKTLRQAILMGDLPPGKRLMEIQLANELGVSRTPIREAIRMLELEGLVVMIPRKGAQVAKMSQKDLNDVLEVRLALEELAIELAYKRITDEEITHLRQALQEFKDAVEKRDLSLIAEKDVALHDIIYSSTKNDKLITILNNLREQLYRYRIEHLKDYNSHLELIREHEIIIDSLSNHELQAAKDAIRIHISNQSATVSRHIKSELN